MHENHTSIKETYQMNHYWARCDQHILDKYIFQNCRNFCRIVPGGYYYVRCHWVQIIFSTIRILCTYAWTIWQQYRITVKYGCSIVDTFRQFPRRVQWLQPKYWEPIKSQNVHTMSNSSWIYLMCIFFCKKGTWGDFLFQPEQYVDRRHRWG